MSGGKAHISQGKWHVLLSRAKGIPLGKPSLLFPRAFLLFPRAYLACPNGSPLWTYGSGAKNCFASLIKIHEIPPPIHHRRSIRLKGYDYSQNGAYFVTICVQNRECLFGEIENGEMVLNDAGKIIKTKWEQLLKYFFNIKLNEFVIMPNHVHRILIIDNNVGVPLVGTQMVGIQNNGQPQSSGQPQSLGQPQGIAPTVGNIIGAFKSLTTNEYICGVKNGKFPPFEKRIWQRNYHEHIIRNNNHWKKFKITSSFSPQRSHTVRDPFGADWHGEGIPSERISKSS